MRSTFWPNRIFERQSCQNSHTGLKFSPKRKKGALFMKIVQNALFRSCAARFGEIKLWASNFSKSLHLSQILFKTGKSALFMKIVGHAQHGFRIFASKLSIRHTGLKFSSKRPNSALSMKIVPNARFRSCAARFRQIKFVSVKVVKIVTLTSKSLQKGKTVRFSWKLYKTLFFGSCAAQFGQTAFFTVKVLKIVKLASKSLQNGKTVRFPWKLDKTLFSGRAQHVLAKSHFWASKFSKSSHWP